MKEVKPQPGFQEKFLSSSADIVIGGSAAGVGKSFALLLEGLRHINNPGFVATIFRRTVADLIKGGGIIDTANKIYPDAGGIPKASPQHLAAFPSGAKIGFSGLQYEKDIYQWQGAQIAYIGFDELTHFTKTQFFYLLSRNRTTCGIKAYMRATCNPEPDSWVAELIEWWIDPVTGYPIPEREGQIKYFTRNNDIYIWGDSIQEVVDQYPEIVELSKAAGVGIEHFVKSLTFISGKITDNQELLKADPSYLGNLLAQSEEEKAKLLYGNWKVRIDGMNIADAEKINEIFTNVVKDSNDYYITIDHARHGKDLCVIMLWQGMECIEIQILTTSETEDIIKIITPWRKEHNIGSGNILCDQDGIGVIDRIKCKTFIANSSCLEEPETKEKGNYEMLKTQLAYRVCENHINENTIRITATNIYVDGNKQDYVQIKSKIYDIPALIKRQLRTIRRKNPDSDKKKRMISKEEQKTLLSGMSPDFADSILMREFFNIIKSGPVKFKATKDIWKAPQPINKPDFTYASAYQNDQDYW